MIQINDFSIHAKLALLLSVLLLATFLFAQPVSSQDGDLAYRNALAIFERRIMPIIKSPNPSSCSECHLSGVDLKDYIQESPEKTFISLRDGELINLQQPSKSKILDLIRMSQPNSSRLTQQARQSELEAFTAWIQASCKSLRLVNAPPLPKEEVSAPSTPVEVIRHARVSRVFDSFVTNVWSQIQRCVGCHAGKTPNALKLIEKHGEQIRWAFDTPQETFNSIIEREYIDVESPEMSLLLMKPTMQMEHGGGKKMEIGDRGYKQFREFIEDYSATVDGYYEVPEQLPTPSEVEFIGSEIWLKVEPTPEAWADKLLGVLIFLFDEKTEKLSPDAIAESDRRVAGQRNLWQHNLILRAPQSSVHAQHLRESRRLPPGRYLIQFFCDANGELEEDWEIELTDMKFFAGQVEVMTDWPVGYNKMLTVHPPKS